MKWVNEFIKFKGKGKQYTGWFYVLSLLCLSPSRLIADILKHDFEREDKRHAAIIVALNKIWFTTALFVFAVFLTQELFKEQMNIFVFLGIVFLFGAMGFIMNEIFALYKIVQGKIIIISAMLIFIGTLAVLNVVFISFWCRVGLILYAVSHVNEVAFAFYRDVIDKLKGFDRKRKLSEIKHGLSFDVRIELALRSYLGLIIEYGIIYYLLTLINFDWISGSSGYLNNIIDATYFSGVTIVTLGYGDYSPQYWLTKLLVVYEVLNGLLLLAVTFTVYSSLNMIRDSEPKRKFSPKLTYRHRRRKVTPNKQ